MFRPSGRALPRPAACPLSRSSGTPARRFRGTRPSLALRGRGFKRVQFHARPRCRATSPDRATSRPSARATAYAACSRAILEGPSSASSARRGRRSTDVPAPAKAQSAPLEAMQDHQVTVDGTSPTPPGPVHRRGDAEPRRVAGRHSSKLPRPRRSSTGSLDEGSRSRRIHHATSEQRIVRTTPLGFDPTDLDGARRRSPRRKSSSPCSAFASSKVRVDDAIVAYVVDLARQARAKTERSSSAPRHERRLP